MTRRDRPSWSHYPEGFSFLRASWSDRARVVGIVLVVILIGLAGSLR